MSDPAAPITLSDALDELCMRFLNNLPASEYEEFERLFFAVEAAHWFYDDFHREENPKLPRLPLQAFAKRIFGHSPLLQPHLAEVDALTARFRTYKHAVPTYGAAMLSPDWANVLLVQAWGKNAKWGFPKGKIAKDETEMQAAAREVYEETGFDFMTVLDPAADGDPFFIDSYAGGKLCRIFVIPNVPEDTLFETRTRKEISNIAWVPVSALPDPRQKAGDVAPATTGQQHQHKWPPKSFWLVTQYVPKLRSYIKRGRKRGVAKSQGSMPALSVAASPQRQRKGIPGGGSGSGNGMASGRQGKGKRETNEFSSRDEETFGGAALAADDRGGGGMTDRERDTLFRQYLADADRRKDELGIGDDFWPVPLVTSKDMPIPKAAAVDALSLGIQGSRMPKQEPKPAAANKRKERPPPKLVPVSTYVASANVVAQTSQAMRPAESALASFPTRRDAVHSSTRPQLLDGMEQSPFRFDRAAVLGCLS